MSTLDYAGIAEASDRVNDIGWSAADALRGGIVKLDRRQFLKLAGIAGGGLMLACAAPRALAHGKSLQPNAFLSINEHDILLAAINPEVGQGVKTSLPMLIAEELDAAWEDVKVLQTRIDPDAYGPQFAGGSQSVPRNWDRLRRAGATARAMLVAAAAQQLGVGVAELETENSHVVHRASGRRLRYGSLAAAAADIPVPDADSLPLKKPADFRLLGRRITGVDNRALVRGEPLFGIDQTLSGVKYAVYQKCPAIGGAVAEANLDAIKAMPGVADAFVLPGNGNAMELLPGVAIVADSTWAALRAKRALEIKWDETGAGRDSWSDAVREADARSRERGETVAESGDADAALEAAEASGKRIGSYYQYHFVSHAQLEPQCCMAYYHKDGSIDLWTPTQTPTSSRGTVAGLLGIDESRVFIYQTRGGGGFGRRLYNDFMCEAAAIARRVDGPVKLQWSREDDMANDFYRAGGFHRLQGAVDADGRISAWRDHFVTFANGGRPVSGGSLSPSVFPGGLIDNLRIEQTALDWSSRCGAWRAPGSNVFGFVVQSFLHELAAAAGRDHLDVLLEVLGEPRPTVKDDRWALHTGRAADVVALAARKAGWGRKLPDGRALGLAFYFSHGGHVAEVAEVSVSDDRRIAVHKVTVAADVGPIVNLSGAENQMEGSVVDGLSTMAGLSVTFENGRAEQSNFHQYPMLRMPAAPQVDVHFVDSGYPPTGLGEPALPPLAPAVCNAVFAATGHRIRTLPISEEGFTIAGSA